MGCSSSAPFAAEGGALGEVKNVADDMMESGERAMHEMGEVAGNAAHEALDHVKDAMTTAAGSVQNAVDNVGKMASNTTHSLTEGIKRETSVLTAPAAPEPFQGNGSSPDDCKHIPLKDKIDESNNVSEMMKEKMKSTENSPSSVEDVPPLEKFKPTPVPSFDKPPTPGTGSPSELMAKPMEKIDEVNASIDKLTDELLKETEAVATEVTTTVKEMKQELPPLDIMKAKLPPLEAIETEVAKMAESAKAELSNMDAAMGEKIDDLKADVTTAEEVAATVKDAINEVTTEENKGDDFTGEEGDDLYMDLPPTKWEALADAIVELPPRMSIDLGTGQLYAVIVEDEGTNRNSKSRSSTLRDKSSGDNHAAKSAL